MANRARGRGNTDSRAGNARRGSRPGGVTGARPSPASRAEGTASRRRSGMERGADSGEEIVVPIVAEEARIGKRQVESGSVRVRKQPRVREETLRIPVTSEHIDVQRREIGAEVDEPIAPWQDGETLVVPVMEQVPVVHMQWVVREEIRITRKPRQEERKQKVRVLHEEAVVDRQQRSTKKEKKI